MFVLWKAVLVACAVAASSRTVAAAGRCNGGVECIDLVDCSGLHSQLQRGATPELTQLLRSLHCGFSGDQPMSVNTGFDLWNSFQLFQQVTRRPKTRKNRKKKKSTTTTTTTTEQSIFYDVSAETTREPSRKQAVQQRLQVESMSTADSKEICCPPEFQSTNFYPVTSTTTSPNNRNGGSGSPWAGGSSNSNNDFDNNSRAGGSGGNRGGSSSGSDWNSDSSAPADPTTLLPDRRTCGIQNNDRIVGGTRADLDEHPWMVLLRYDKPYGSGFYCGGVLISSRYVLTAAHCVKGQDLPTNWKLSQVRLGEWNTSTTRDCVRDDCADPVQDIVIEERLAHESYDPQDPHQHNDIALLRLAQEAQITDFVKPICLPLTRDLKNNGFEGYMMEVAGWGKTESRSESDVKLKVGVPVVSRSECAQVFNRVGREINNKQLCAGGSAGKDSCRGDSGGALMGRVPTANNWFAFGVVSYGPSPCGTPGWPGVYTRVGAYVDWILSKIRR